jgi:prophage regulatory protein
MATVTVMLRLPQVQARTGLSRSQIYQLIADGEFPRQVKLSERAAGWVADDVEAWLTQRIRASRFAAAA